MRLQDEIASGLRLDMSVKRGRVGGTCPPPPALILIFLKHHISVLVMTFAFGTEVPLWLWVRIHFGADVGATPKVLQNVSFSQKCFNLHGPEVRNRALLV